MRASSLVYVDEELVAIMNSCNPLEMSVSAVMEVFWRLSYSSSVSRASLRDVNAKEVGELRILTLKKRLYEC